MSDKRKSMQITLTLEQTERLLAWSRGWVRAEVEADCDPSGYYLEIGMGAGSPPSIEAIKGSDRVDLGDVAVEFVEQS